MSILFTNDWERVLADENLLSTIKGKIEEGISGIGFHIKSISLGCVPPDISLHDIPCLSDIKQQLLFKTIYVGDAKLTVEMKISHNPPIPVTATIYDLRLKGLLLVDLSDCSDGKHLSCKYLSNPVQSIQVDCSIPMANALIREQLMERLRIFFINDLPELATHVIPVKVVPVKVEENVLSIYNGLNKHDGLNLSEEKSVFTGHSKGIVSRTSFNASSRHQD